ncbi:MAG: alpha/beta hydrolase [Pseudomonadota bacterium]
MSSKVGLYSTLVLIGLLALSTFIAPVKAERPVSRYSLEAYTPVERALTIEETVFQNEDGESVRGEKGFMTVPEIRGAEQTRDLRIAFIRVKAQTENPAPPVVLLHGGPSENGIVESRSKRINVLTQMQDVADLILIDGRGLGLSTPTLKCKIEEPRLVFDFEQMREMYEQEGRECRDYWQQKGITLDGYNPLALADDVADLMVSLGYDKFSVMGNSYGAYWSISLAKRHPDLIHRIAISGIFGLDGSFNLPSDAQSAFDDLLTRLEETEAVEDLFGDRGIKTAFADVMNRLAENPVSVDVELFGEKETLTFDPETLARILYFAEATQHRQGATQLPLLIYALDNGAYEGLAKLLIRRMENKIDENPLYHGLSSVSIICNQVNSPEFLQDFERAQTAPVEAVWAGQVMKKRNAAYACDEVGYPKIDADWASGFTSDIPVLAAIGSFDGNTPPQGAFRSLSNFTNVKSIVFEGGGHRHKEFEKLWPELAEYRQQFFAGAELDGVPDRVELPEIEAGSLNWFLRFLFSIGLGNFVLGWI